jgi:uncharacterized protein (DUF362 family)
MHSIRGHFTRDRIFFHRYILETSVFYYMDPAFLSRKEKNMPKLTRREFLHMLATGMTAMAIEQFLAACGQKEPLDETILAPTRPASRPTTKPVAPQPSATVGQPQPVEPTQDVALPAQPSATPTPPGAPDIAVARGGEPEDLIRRALQAFGGIGTFVPKGAKVIIKPNICVAYHSYEYAATTNPFLVGALVKMCLEAGAASVQVMDTPFGGTAKEAYAISGIQDQVQAAGGEMAFMPGFKYVDVTIPNAIKLQKTSIFDDILKTDVLINVPIAKHHSLAGLTLGMKNLMGVIRDRSSMHFLLGMKLADLAGRIRPTLTVVDAIRILTNNGPTGGNLDDVKKLDTVIVSQDIVAADSYGATLFGLEPGSLDYIAAGVQSGLGRSDLKNMRIEEIPVGG